MKSISRLSHILDLAPPAGRIESFGLIGAYCACLTPTEAVELLLESAGNRYDIRDTVLRKVCAHIDAGYAECHQDLLEALLSKFSAADSRSRQGLGYCLSSLVRHVPANERRRIQSVFLSSIYVGVRRRGYKSIQSGSDVPFDNVLAAWQRFSDPECAWLMVKTFPPDFLYVHRAELEPSLDHDWHRARLYLRIAGEHSDVLDELKSKDEISYCYVMAKLKKSLNVIDAIAIADRASDAERFGLLIWSLGELSLWEALEHIEAQLPAILSRLGLKRHSAV